MYIFQKQQMLIIKKITKYFESFLKIVFVYSQLIVNLSFKICKQTLTLELY